MTGAPKMLGKWIMHRALDSGAFGVAWLAEDSTKPGVYAVIKFLAGSPLEEPIEVTKARFEREREILSGLNNQHVCKLLDDDLNSEPPWVAVDYLPGKSLQGSISDAHVLDETEWFRLASDMLNGLAYLHAQNIIHRDLNPKNILVTSIGYKIIDFGISYKQGLPQVTVGNLRHFLFCSPEQLEMDGKITAKSDIFSLATLLVFAGTNRSPWTSDQNAMNNNISPISWGEIATNTGKAEPIYHSLSTNQKMFLRKLHEKDPAQRPTANEALDLLVKLATRAFLSPVTSTQMKPKTSQQPPVRKVAVKKAVAKKATFPANSKQNNVQQLQKSSKQRRAPLTIKEFFSKYWKDLLIGWVTTPIGWLVYRYFKNKDVINSNTKSKEDRNLRIAYLVVHGLSFGLFAFPISLYMAKKIRSQVRVFYAVLDVISFITLISVIFTTPVNGTAPTWWIMVFFIHFVMGFFFPLFLKFDKPFSKSPDLPDVDSALQKSTVVPKASWNILNIEVIKLLKSFGQGNFGFSISARNIEGIYFQGYYEKAGQITIEAAANLSVRPEITVHQNRELIRLGWEPPAGDNPNYIQFLNLDQSSFEFVAELVVKSVRDGYGADLEGLFAGLTVSTMDGGLDIWPLDEIEAVNGQNN